jgi:hypothetical protein
MPVNPELSQENWLRFQYCRDRGHIDFITKADRCEHFFVGEQWNKDDLSLLRTQKRPAMTINKIMSTLANIFGEQIHNRTEVLFRPKNGSPEETAEALTKIWMHVSQENQLPWKRSDLFADGCIRSRGFLDVRMKFDDSMQGEIEIDNLNSKNVVIDPDADSYDPDEWNDVFITKWLSGQDIAILYNEDDGDYLARREGSSYVYGFDSLERVRDRFGGILPVAGYYDVGDKHNVRRNVRVLERQYRKLDKQLHFVDIETGDMRPVPSDWDRNKIASLMEKAQGRLSTTKKLIKRIRWCVTADNVLLHDDWSPYKHFTVVPYFPTFRYGKTVGLVEGLLGPQEILNKVSSQELHIVNTTANSGWILEANSLMNMSVEELEEKGATTGLVLEYMKGAQPPQKITPNQTPSGLDRISYKAEEHIKGISGVSDSMQGFDREDVAAKAIQYKQQRGAVNLTKVLDNLERTDYILARNCIDLIQEFYTEARIVNITHADITQQPETVEVNQYDEATGRITNDLTIGEYDITVTSSPHRASLEDSQFEQAMAMREAGIQIPDSVLIENSRLMRRSEIIKQMEGDKDSPEYQAEMQRKERGAEAEVSALEGDAALKHAQVAKTQAEAETASQGDSQAELVKMQQEMQMEQEKNQMELQKMREEMDLKYQEMMMKVQMKQEEHAQDAEIKQQEHQQNAVIREQDAVMKRQMMAKQAAEQGEESGEPAQTNTTV